jgi:hypothetical protein
MEETYVVQAEYEEALKLADIYSILQELKSVMETCTRLRQLLKAEQKDWLLIESIWTAALIRYSRCYASGKRHGLSEDIYKDLPGDAIGVHRLYENLRNKHIAHSVNPFEQVKVGLILSSENSQEKKVMEVSPFLMKLVPTTDDDVRQLGALVKVLVNKLMKNGEQYEEEALRVGRSLPIDELYSLPRLRTVAPGQNDAGKAR